MSDRSVQVAGLRTIEVIGKAPPRLTVVVLHGYAMSPEDLAPFASSVGVPARFLFPEAPLRAVPTGRAWWAIDPDARSRALAAGPRDLFEEHPPGAASARERLLAFLDAIRSDSELPVVLAGFSQGGMLACDTLLREQLRVAALVLLSSSRIAADDWEPRIHRLQRLPAFVSHGHTDPDLAFSAGEALRDLLERGGADVTWVPFDSGHEIPLVVWRALRKFLSALG